MGLLLSRNLAGYIFSSPLFSKKNGGIPMQLENMVSLVSRTARTGRHLQRYDKGCRQVVGCIPYRYRQTEQESSSLEDIEVLVISSQKGQGILFPKGGWELDESIEEAAHRETYEEAGVTGHLEQPRLGKWQYKSKSQGTINHDGYMFPLLVDQQFESWPEKTVRKREWMTIAEAKEACQNWWMREALDEFENRRQTQAQEKEAHNVPVCT